MYRGIDIVINKHSTGDVWYGRSNRQDEITFLIQAPKRPKSGGMWGKNRVGVERVVLLV